MGKSRCVRTSAKLPQVTGVYSPNLLIVSLFSNILSRTKIAWTKLEIETFSPHPHPFICSVLHFVYLFNHVILKYFSVFLYFLS